MLAAGQQSTPQAAVALEELCRTYWYPLYAYVRRQGHTREDAEDLTQGFFARFLERNYLAGLSSDRGRFRAFLLASLKHYLANARDRAQALKRGGSAPPLPLDWQDADRRYQSHPADTLGPDRHFDREWALALLERVIRRLRGECSAEGKAVLFEQLKSFLTADRGEVPYPQAAAQLGLPEVTVRVTVHRLRRRYRELLREEIAQTLTDSTQVAEEMRALFGAFT